MTRTTEVNSPATLCSSLESYVSLLRVLLPRASSINIYDERGELLWATDLSKSPEISELVAQSLSDSIRNPQLPGRFQLLDSIPVYLFWLRRDDSSVGTMPLATLVVRLRAGGNIESCSFGFVHQIVQPAIDCLQRDLLARDEILRLRNSMQEQPQNLDMLKVISGSAPDGPAGGVEDLKSILANATTHMKVGMAALIVPEKGLALVHAADDCSIDRGLPAKAHRHLLSLAKMRREPIIINRMPMPRDASLVYRVLACSVCRPDGHSSGVLALFRPESAAEFTSYHAQVIELLGSRIAAVIASDYDALTGLLTRPALERRMRAVEQGQSKAQVTWSALHLDVDRMDAINDGHGMHTGDRLLRQLGELIRRQMPSGALAARASADRFTILLPVAIDDAVKVAEALRQSAEQIGGAIGAEKIAVSISIGVAPVPSNSKDLSHVLALAETACKAAKVRGPNRVELYQEADQSIVRRMTDLRLVANLRQAITENTLQLAAQLIVPLGDRAGPAQFELLLRMINEKGKRIGPSQFMPSALRHQLMPTIDRWVIQRAIELLKPQPMLLLQDPMVFTINLSAQSLQDEAFTADVEAMIVASGLNPAALCFELTEDAMVSNLALVEPFMRKLSKLGSHIALDDFGTGLSSLAYLRSLPIRTLKIDGSFVRDVLTDPKADSMVRTIAQLAHSMSLLTVAKHIEKDEICTRVTTLGVDYGQGFAIAAPAPLESVLAELPTYATLSLQKSSGSWRQMQS